MKLKVNNNAIKENKSMEERNEAVGLKVKDVRQIKEEPEVIAKVNDTGINFSKVCGTLTMKIARDIICN